MNTPFGDVQESQRIGPYIFLQQIGEGGMGEVWMAEQTEPIQRRVAIKLIKGGMNHKQVIARFEAERQALSMMNHENIAKVFDAGNLQNGMPFFVMELVQGISLTKYCDRNRLTPPERLDLFIKVCSAVQHAHQKGVIHRDLKPSNILVALYDGIPVPKVIDFGLAKALMGTPKLTDKTMFTHFGQVIGTLRYMSPEQSEMNALDVDTRTDIYSLGVILYELLTGTTPLDVDTLDNEETQDLLKILREKDPPKPSNRLGSSSETITGISEHRQTEPKKLHQMLKGDLDWIVMKALEKDRTRRYETANGLRLDVIRYINNEPIEARPPSNWYRLRKSIHKHRVFFGTATAIVLLMFLGIVGTSIGLARARQAEKRAVNEKYLADVERDRADRSAKKASLAERKARAAEQLANHSAAETKKALIRVEAEKTKVEVAERVAALRLYQNQIQLADTHWNNGNAGAARTALANTAAELRGWDFDYLTAKFERNQKALLGATSSVNQIAFLAGNQQIVGVSWDGTIRFWNWQSGELDRTFDFEGKQFTCLSLHPNKPWIAVAGNSSAVDIVDMKSGKTVKSLQAEKGSLMRIEFSANGSLLAGCGRGQPLTVWNVQSAEIVHQFPHGADSYVSVKFTSDSERLIAGRNKGSIEIWNLADASLLRELKGHTDEVSSLDVSADDNILVSGSFDQVAKIWDLQSGKNLRSLKGHQGYLQSVALSSDGTMIATTGRDLRIRIWETASGDLINELIGHSQSVESVLFLDADHQVASCSYDRSVKIWKIDEQYRSHHISPVGHSSLVRFVDISPDETRIASADLAGMKIWNAKTGKLEIDLAESLGKVDWCAFGPQSQRIFVGLNSNSIGVVDVQTGEILHKLIGHTGLITDIEISADGKWLASCAEDNTIRLWDTETYQLVRSFKDYEQTPYYSWLTNDRKRMVSLDKSHNVKVWSLEDFELLETYSNIATDISGVGISEDGKSMLYGDSMGKCYVLDLQTGKTVHKFLGHQQKLSGLRFLPKGNQFVTGSWDKSVRIWSGENFELTISLTGFLEPITSLSVSRNGDLIVAGGFYGAMRIWSSKFAAQRTPSETEYWTRQGIRIGLAPDRQKSEYEQSLKLAHRGHSSFPCRESLLAVGVNQYRLGRYEAAINSLSEQVSLKSKVDYHTAEPIRLAFLAMTQFRLQHSQEAKATLDQLRNVMQTNDFDQRKWLVTLLAEVDELLQSK